MKPSFSMKVLKKTNDVIVKICLKYTLSHLRYMGVYPDALALVMPALIKINQSGSLKPLFTLFI